MEVKFLAEALFLFVKTVKLMLSSFRMESVTEMCVD
jgi:hypothetical protein